MTAFTGMPRFQPLAEVVMVIVKSHSPLAIIQVNVGLKKKPKLDEIWMLKGAVSVPLSHGPTFPTLGTVGQWDILTVLTII